ncbi:MAG: NosR/NirI family nitrous oxide reductase transcriptional regulator [Paracoccaceae bacterium]|jgi:NosR/NirI family nitrous oxide reductase transcriptional regulator
MHFLVRLARALFLVAALASPALADEAFLPPDAIAAKIEPPYQLGERLSDDGVWSIVNLDGKDAGYVFQTAPLAPLPGFSGAPIDMLVTLDLEGRFINVELLKHNEPIFVSGLGQAPFHEFMRQYKGLSIADAITVGVPYGEAAQGSDMVFLHGVTKATASVRIAHESILAAAYHVARQRMQGLGGGPPMSPDLTVDENLSWSDLVAQGIAKRRLVTNAEVDAAFADTTWEDDDPIAREDPEGAFLDLVVVDLGAPSVARAALSPSGWAELREFLTISKHDEPILVMDYGRHGLLSPTFIRNTAPEWLSARQSGLPIALRDADLLASLADDVPEPNAFIILRTDRRLGFDPTAPWDLSVRALREHGSFRPEVGSTDFSLEVQTPARFYMAPPAAAAPKPVWVEALLARRIDLIVVAAGMIALGAALAFRQSAVAALKRFTPYRLAFLAAMIVFVGWWGQGQLSIVTPLAVLRTAVEGGSFAFLLYDPFSLVIWGATIAGFVVWGRGFFCGWLCPFGAMQELTHHLGRLLRIPQIRMSARWDARLKWVKYGVLAALTAATLISPSATDAMIEVEPFKTAVTTYFIRDWFYVAYAALWLILGMSLFKSFCRYVCPLGALMAIGGLLRGRDWIPRRVECGSPCQLCAVRCRYQAIEKSGAIRYDECFQCLDCVTIHDSPKQCVPLVLAAKRAKAGRPAAPALKMPEGV